MSGCFMAVDGDVLETCRRHGLVTQQAGPGEAFLWATHLVPFLADLRALGGSWKSLADTVVWHMGQGGLAESTVERVRPELPLVQPFPDSPGTMTPHGEGLFEVVLDQTRAVVWSGFKFHPDPRAREPVLLIVADDREAALGIVRAVLTRRRPPRLRLWGGVHQTASPAPVSEDQVVLPPCVRDTLLPELDRFWRHAGRAWAEGLAVRRGLLLVGPPGTGKTQLVRHLITRYAEVNAHLFVPESRHARDDLFGAMLAHIREVRGPAMVILEDIDRLEHSGAVTAGYLLNCLDGLLESPVPILWVATSNDPAQLDATLLDRPGRFDRTVVFELPGLEQREELLRLHLPSPPSPECLRTAAEAAAGLGGAHLREACVAARLRALDTDGMVEEFLLPEIQRIKGQQRQSRELARVLSHASVGFHGQQQMAGVE